MDDCILISFYKAKNVWNVKKEHEQRLCSTILTTMVNFPWQNLVKMSRLSNLDLCIPVWCLWNVWLAGERRQGRKSQWSSRPRRLSPMFSIVSFVVLFSVRSFSMSKGSLNGNNYVHTSLTRMLEHTLHSHDEDQEDEEERKEKNCVHSWE